MRSIVHQHCNCSQSLSHVTPLRNYFLREENYCKIKRPPGDQQFLLVQRFGELIRKLWNPRNFKAHVSPHEMLQAVVLCSKKRFQITQQGQSQARWCPFLALQICYLVGSQAWGIVRACKWFSELPEFSTNLFSQFSHWISSNFLLTDVPQFLTNRYATVLYQQTSHSFLPTDIAVFHQQIFQFSSNWFPPVFHQQKE